MTADIASLVTTVANSSGLHVLRGRVMEIAADGRILVRNETDGTCISCGFLITSSAPPPEMASGDLVLYLQDEKNNVAHVLGLLETNREDNHPRRIKIQAEDSIEIHCGKSLLSMNRYGEVILRGMKLLSRASGSNKIKGATVKIN